MKRLFLRILSFPFIAAILLINSIVIYLTTLYKLARYGGETFVYNKDDKKTIYGLYQKLKGGGTIPEI